MPDLRHPLVCYENRKRLDLDLPKTALEALCKLVGAALHGRAVQREADVRKPAPGQARQIRFIPKYRGSMCEILLCKKRVFGYYAQK